MTLDHHAGIGCPYAPSTYHAQLLSLQTAGALFTTWLLGEIPSVLHCKYLVPSFSTLVGSGGEGSASNRCRLCLM